MEDSIRIIQYLGSKMRINDYIFQEVKRITPDGGTVADLFSGSGVVSYNLGKKYRVFANDIQMFCRPINETLLCDLAGVDIPTLEDLKMSSEYINNRDKLEELFETALKNERELLNGRNIDQLVSVTEHGIFYDKTNLEDEYEGFNKTYFGKAYDLFDEKQIKKAQTEKEYMLFCLYYLNSYFSLEQCIEIDSLKCAIDSVSNEKARIIFVGGYEVERQW